MTLTELRELVEAASNKSGALSLEAFYERENRREVQLLGAMHAFDAVLSVIDGDESELEAYGRGGK